ncbi:MAG: hypothetical protein M3Y56_09580, partial [Armatimonadota bacterium]|nr:hypothetical protein [Armatimonadota bacterium]
TSPPTGEDRIRVDRFTMIDALFPAYPRPYFARVLPLLESPRLADREAGQSCLFRSLYGDFGFHPGDLPAQRAEELKSIRSLLTQLSTMDEPTMRRSILQARGIPLSAPSSGVELEELARSAGSLDGVAAFNALALLDLRLGTHLEESLGGLPPLERGRAVAAFLQDRNGGGRAVS